MSLNEMVVLRLFVCMNKQANPNLNKISVFKLATVRLFEQRQKSHHKEILIFCIVMYFILAREKEREGTDNIWVFVHLPIGQHKREKR